MDPMEDFEIDLYNPLDETGNFGVRNTDLEGSLNEIITLATFTYPKDVDELDCMCSLVSNNTLYLAIGKRILIFSDPSSLNMLFDARFAHTVDCICLCKKYLIIILRNGNVNVVDMSTYTIICTSVICENVWYDEKYFIETFVESFEDEPRFYVVTRKGELFSISFIFNENMEMQLQSEIVSNLRVPVFQAAFIDNELLMYGDNKLYVYYIDDDEINLIQDSIQIKRIYAVNQNNSFMVLTEDGNVFTYLRSMLTSQLDGKFVDIIFYDNFDGSSSCMFLSRNELGLYVKLLKCPDFTTSVDFTPIYSLRLTLEKNYFIFSNVNDGQMFISKFDSRELRLQIICETMPEQRLDKLLKKQKYNEAETFAKEYNLSLTIVQKARALSIVDKTICNMEDVVQLIKILDGLSDYFFKVSCCLDIICDCAESTLKILNYGSRLELSKEQARSDDGAKLISNSIRIVRYKFTVYLAMMKINGEDFDPYDWNDNFLKYSFYDNLHMQLKEQNLSASIIFYDKMDINDGNMTDMNVNNILQILKKMPFNTYMSFLNVFIPKTLKHIPSSIGTIVEWTQEVVYVLEKSHSFPENAISFVNNMQNLLDVDVMLNIKLKQEHQRKDIWNKFSAIVESLEIIHVLKNNFKVYVKLQDCLMGPLSLVDALFRLEIAEFNDLIQKFLSKYLIKHHLDPDQIFYDKIKEFVTDYNEMHWMIVVPAIWNSIISKKTKLHAILLILEKSDMPWSSTIHGMLADAFKLHHPLVETIQNKVKSACIYMVLKNPVYGLNSFTIDYLTENVPSKIIERIIDCNQPTMQEDIYTISLSNLQKAFATYYIVKKYATDPAVSTKQINNLINSRSCEELLEFLKMIPRVLNELKIPCLNNEAYWQDMKTLEIFINVFNTAINKAASLMSDSQKEMYLSKLQQIMRYQKIKMHFTTKITINEIEKDWNKKEILAKLVNETIGYVKLDLEKGIMKCHNIAEALNIKFEQGLIEICVLYPELNLLKYALKYCYERTTDWKILIALPILVLQINSSQEKDLINNTLKCDKSIDDLSEGTDLNSLKNCIKYAKDIIIKCMIKSNCEAVYEIFNWMHIYLTEDIDKKSRNVLFDNIFSEDSYSLLVVNEAINSIFTEYAMYICATSNTPTSKILRTYSLKPNLISILEEEEIVNYQVAVRNNIYGTLNILAMTGNYFTASNILLCLKDSLLCTNAFYIDEFDRLLKQYNILLFQKVVAAPHIDKDMILCLLRFHSCEKGITLIDKALKLYKLNLDKFKTIAELGIDVLKYHKVNDKKRVELFQSFILLVKWFQRIEKSKISFKDFTLLPRESLLKLLIEYSHITSVKEIIEFSTDFKFNPVKYYILLLNQSLINWKPKYKIETLKYIGKGSLIMESTEDKLYQKCLDIVERIPDKEIVFQMMNSIVASVNVYHYEVFICIHKLMQSKKDEDSLKRDLLLKFLQKYERVSVPNSYECEEWSTKFPDVSTIDPLSEWRLPFTPTLFTNDIWNILKSEINLHNYTIWFDSLIFLDKHLNKDDICSYAVREAVLSVFQNTSKTNEWALYPKYKDLLVDIDNCISQISNNERATSVAYHVTMHMPQGADQVNAARLCFKYAGKYRNSSQVPVDNDVYKAFKKVYRKYHNSAATHILHTYELAEPQYLELVGQPMELIEALYTDNRIMKSEILIEINCPDINKTVDELAALYKIDIEEKRRSLIQCWLSDSSVNEVNLEESICLMPAMNLTSSSNDDLYMKKIFYLCSSADTEKWLKELISLGFSETSTDLKLKARAIKCSCVIASSTPDIPKLVEYSYEELLHYSEQLFLMHDLQCLGITIDLENFNKTEMLTRLSKNNMNPLSIKCMASICMIYGINIVKYWQLIINSMVKLRMVEELKTSIHFFGSEMLCQQFYIDAWQCVTDNSFDKLSDYNGDDFNEACVENVQTLQSCPVLANLNLEYSYSKCLQVKRCDLATVLTQYFEPEEQTVYIKDVLKLIDKKELLVQMEKLYNNYNLLHVSDTINLIKLIE